MPETSTGGFLEDEDEDEDDDAEKACTTDEADEDARIDAAANTETNPEPAFAFESPAPLPPPLPLLLPLPLLPVLPIRMNFLSEATAAAPFCDVCDTTGDDIARLKSSFCGDTDELPDDELLSARVRCSGDIDTAS